LRTVAASAPFSPSSHRAIVVGDAGFYGLARLFEAYSEVVQHSDMVRAFGDRESALRWIEEARQGR
jgi:hypothetical protein